MVQRSAREEDSLVSQRKEYENMLSQQRGLYGEKMTELEKLHSQRKEYEAELEMLQEQKKSYEAKVEEYEALQLQKKDYEAKLSELESALVKEIQSERTASEEILELQRKELMTKLEQLEVAMTLRQKEEEIMVVREKEKRISELEDTLRSKSVAEQVLEQQKQEKKKKMDELEKSLAAVEEELSLKRTEHSTSMTEQKKQFEALIEQQRKEYDSNVQELESIRSEKDNYEAKLDKFRAQKQELQSKIEEMDDLHRQKKNYERKLEELQKALEEQRAKRVAAETMDQVMPMLTPEQLEIAKKVYRIWGRYRFYSLKDELLSNASILKEANAISVELQKHVSFQFLILTDTPYSPIPFSVSTGTDVDIDLEESKFAVAQMESMDPFRPKGPLVAVEVKDSKHGATHMWSISKLRQRMMVMREMYESACHPEPSPPTSSLGMIGGDPFYDRNPWFKLIGRSFVYLSNLLQPTSLVHQVAIVSERGEVKGHLTVSVRFMPEEEMEGSQTSTISFHDLENCGPVEGTPHKMKVLTGPTEIAANVIDNPLEASVELGSEVALSGSQNDMGGARLMSRHISSEGGAPLKSLALRLGEKKAGSAFFKPIVGPSATDELKLGAAESNKLFKPTPTIRVNDADLRLSPGSPRVVALCGVTSTGFTEPPPVDASEEVRAIFERGQLSNKDSLDARPHSLPGRESPSSRRDSINQLQRLQQHNRVPHLGGKFISTLKPAKDLLKEGSNFTFRVTILQATGIPRDFTDVFLQFKFLNGGDEAFSTVSLKNENQDLALGFYHMQNLTVKVNRAFIHYLHTYPLILEAFGHYHHHPLHKASTEFEGTQSGSISPARMIAIRSASPLPPSKFATSPIRSAKTVVFDATGTTHAYAQVDIMAYFEICELDPSGEYVPAAVHHGDATATGGVFLLQQGVQRRLRITLVYEAGSEIHWTRVNELVIGRVRSTLEVATETEHQSTVLSLKVLQPHYQHLPGDQRTYYLFEAAWDSSLHNSALLNRLGGGDDLVYITTSAYIELEKSSQPACFTKDLCVRIHGRESRPTPPRSLFNILMGQKPAAEHNRCVGIYELSLRKTIEKAHEFQGPVVDTSALYVRGEENLRGWRARRESLIFDHQETLTKLTMIEETEKARHILQVRQKLLESQTARRGVATWPSDEELSKLSDEHKAMLAQKCVGLLMRNCTTEDASLEAQEDARSVSSNASGGGSPTRASPPHISPLITRRIHHHAQRGRASPPMCVPEVQEKTHTKRNPVSRRGYLNLYGEQDAQWHRKYVVVRRPYVLLYENEKDPVEWGILNLAGAKVQHTEANKTNANTFSICTKHRGLLFQTKERELSDWIYAMDPLLAGSLKSQLSSKKKNSVS
jgi:flagellar biosynthesis chaperone FliJ